ncbi:hypothetical protein [Vibrio sp. SCSIO 43136]|uniref:hypothetical protein n=1 Tax=Vibrio sp. SCSIO 43136 TaxID=2819101 RepID=UPI002075BAAE|nr:hypothetical protein [Vibrio sp. SCSIO 43136]USD66045.1 hypothetical protein J4N39_04265 [Vibrio sp. SCSIO 43136]
MTVSGTNVANTTLQPQQTQLVKPTAESGDKSSTPKVAQNTVTLSAEGKALLAALQAIEDQNQKAIAEQKAADKTITDDVEAFAHGALGMDHPDDFKEQVKEDSSYTAGQYLSAAATIGGLVLLLA